MKTWTIAEVAQRANVTKQAVLRRIQRGTLPALKVNGVWEIPQEAVSETTVARNVDDNRRRQPRAPREVELETTRAQRDELRQEVKRLHTRIEHLEAMNERLTRLLENEQALRLRALPRPFKQNALSWLARWFKR